MKVKLKPFQDHFLFSEKRFPALVSAVGTGKTFMLLLKIWNFCETYPGARALVVRMEFTDLHDSTLMDFRKYFNVDVNSNKDYHFANGSIIMFRHGAELNVLKNLTLDIVGIEQAEEFETEEQFDYLRDRLRGKSAPNQQLCLIANANGHNWIWRRWVSQPASAEYDVQQATTFDNEDNLPASFVADLRTMEVEAPNHYQQYVMNSHETASTDDTVLTPAILGKSIAIQFFSEGTRKRILSVDVARYGSNESVYTLLESRGPIYWEQVHQEVHLNQGVDQTIGRTLVLAKDFVVDGIVVDDDGVGGGVTDLVKTQTSVTVHPFNGGLPSANPKYDNTRTEAAFKVRDLCEKGWLKALNDPKLYEQAMSVRFKFTPSGKRVLISKEIMRSKGIPSPDRFDALLMACFFIEQVMAEQRPGAIRHRLQRELVVADAVEV